MKTPLLFLALLVLFSTSAYPLTARVTWDMNAEPDLEGYGIYYRVDGGEWRHHRDLIAAGMSMSDGKTGRWFTAPDNGKRYEIVITAYDTSGNRSGSRYIVTIDTFARTVGHHEEVIPIGQLNP